MNYLQCILVISVLLCLSCECAFSQKQTSWIGGFPGREHDWFCARNWDTNVVPNEFSAVIISSQKTKNDAYPIITKKEARIWSIVMDKKAKLLITSKATLNILDYVYIPNCHSIINQGNFVIDTFNSSFTNLNSNYITNKN